MTDLEKIYTLFGLTTDDVSETVAQYYLDEWNAVFTDNSCLALYNASVSVLEYVIREADISDASTGTLASEKEGNVTIEYDTNTDSSSSDYWKDILDRFLGDPTAVFPSCRDELKHGKVVFFGGTSQREVNRIKNNSDTLNQYSVRSPFAAKTPDHRGRGGGRRSDDINGIF